MARQIDFTKGGIAKQLVLFSLPLVMGELLQNLYNSVDALVVGNWVSDTALGAVSVCATLVNLVVGFFNGMSVGATAVVARAFGTKDADMLKRTVQATFTFSTVLGVLLSILGILGTEFLIGLSAVDEDIYAEAVVYLRIYLAGILFAVLYNNGAGILRAIGDTKTPFVILSISGGLNILLDILFVVALHMGVAGVSYATLIAQIFSAAIVYRQINGRCKVRCLALKETFLSGRKIIAEVIRIGIPSGMQGALISFSNLFIWRYVNRFGPAATAGVGVAQRLDKFVGLPCKALGITTTTFVSQNLGAGNHGRIRKGTKTCFLLSLGVTLVMELVVYTFAEGWVSLFNANPEIISIGADMIHVIIPLYVFLSVREVLVGVLRGHGYAQVTLILSLAGMVGVRQLYLWLSMANYPAIENVYCCYPLAWGSTTLMLMVYYQIVRRDPSWFGETAEKVEQDHDMQKGGEQV